MRRLPDFGLGMPRAMLDYHYSGVGARRPRLFYAETGWLWLGPRLRLGKPLTDSIGIYWLCRSCSSPRKLLRVIIYLGRPGIDPFLRNYRDIFQVGSFLVWQYDILEFPSGIRNLVQPSRRPAGRTRVVLIMFSSSMKQGSWTWL